MGLCERSLHGHYMVTTLHVQRNIRLAMFVGGGIAAIYDLCGLLTKPNAIKRPMMRGLSGYVMNLATYNEAPRLLKPSLLRRARET